MTAPGPQPALRIGSSGYHYLGAAPLRLTADWTYLRFHGQDCSQPYSPQKLAATARRIAGWLAQGIGVHAYFNNDAEGHAFHNVLMLKRYLARPGWPATASAGTARSPQGGTYSAPEPAAAGVTGCRTGVQGPFSIPVVGWQRDKTGPPERRTP